MVSVTSHAKRRLKERCGVSKNSAMNMAERAFNKGISFENASTELKKYISSVYIRHEKTGDNIRIYGNMVYVFDNRTLITVYYAIRQENKDYLSRKARITLLAVTCL